MRLGARMAHVCDILMLMIMGRERFPIDDAEHEENLRSLQDTYADTHEAEHIADTYEQTRKTFIEFTPDELHDRAAKTLDEQLKKSVE